MPLPTFIIAGERRCGTTSLVRWIEAHPDVYMHPGRDMAYFLEDEIVGKSSWLDGDVDADLWEQTHSPEAYAKLFQDGDGCQAIGEKSADYLFWQPAHERIARYLPETRFIITLRNPVDRAWSHYWNEVGKGRETLSFEDALDAEQERFRESAWAKDHLSYIARGFYDESLKAFFQHIHHSRCMIVTIEQCRAEPTRILKKMYRFIGVDPDVGCDLAGTKHNVNWTMVSRSWAGLPGVKVAEQLYTRVVRKIADVVARDTDRRREVRKRLGSVFQKPAANITMSEKGRDYLEKLYEPHNKALEALLGRQFGEWR